MRRSAKALRRFKLSDMGEYFDAMKNRRSFYAIEKASPVPDGRIRELVGAAVLHTPTAFNMQSGRAVLLLGDQHDRLWAIVMETLRAIVPAQRFGGTERKIGSFAAGYGTVLYFDDTAVTSRFAAENPTYSENFPVWAQQSNGMLQFNVWCLLEEAGFGASLQHYNPLIDDEVRRTWALPADWRLIAQMPFGRPTSQPGEKEFDPLEERFLVFD